MQETYPQTFAAFYSLTAEHHCLNHLIFYVADAYYITAAYAIHDSYVLRQHHEQECFE